MPAQKVYPERSRMGFTLIELLVVISIIAILSSVGLVSYQGIRGKTIEAKVKADIDAIKKAYESNYDPTANGGQGGYKPLLDRNFASGKIPTDKDGGSYIVVGSYATAANPNPTTATTNFGICGDINTGQACTLPGGSCKCVQSTQGTGSIDFLSAPSNVVYSESFEGNDSDNNGIFADGWIQTWVGGPHPAGSIVSYNRGSPGFDKNYSQKVTNAQFQEAIYSPSITLQPNTTYTYSAWVKLTAVTGTMPGVNIRIALNSGGCGVPNSPWLTTLNQYTKLSVTFNTTNPSCPTNNAPTSAIITVQPVEAGAGSANTASYEADAVQIVREN